MEDQWAEYQKFSKKLREEQATLLPRSENGSPQTAQGAEKRSKAQELLAQAIAAGQAENTNGARDLLGQVERLNPKEPMLWAVYSALDMKSGDVDLAITDLRKKVQFHPDEIPAYRGLSALLVHTGRPTEAIEVWRAALAVKPEDVPAVLAKPIAAAPQNYHLQALGTEALLRGGHKQEGVEEAQRLLKATSQSTVLNDLAYALADSDAALGLAQQLAEKAVNQIEQDAAKTSLAAPERKDVAAAPTLAATWDTLGWTY